MLPGRITGASRTFGPPPGWSRGEHGPCATLAVRDEMSAAGPVMTSAWFPTPDEIARITCGAPVYLTMLGQGHPPVAMTVGDVPEMMIGDEPG